MAASSRALVVVQVHLVICNRVYAWHLSMASEYMHYLKQQVLQYKRLDGQPGQASGDLSFQ